MKYKNLDDMVGFILNPGTSNSDVLTARSYKIAVYIYASLFISILIGWKKLHSQSECLKQAENFL